MTMTMTMIAAWREREGKEGRHGHGKVCRLELHHRVAVNEALPKFYRLVRGACHAMVIGEASSRRRWYV